MARSRRSKAKGFRSAHRRIADVRAGRSVHRRIPDLAERRAEGRSLTRSRRRASFRRPRILSNRRPDGPEVRYALTIEEPSVGVAQHRHAQKWKTPLQRYTLPN